MFGLFNSASKTQSRTDVSDQTANTVSDGGAAYTAALGGFDVSTGKNSSVSNVVYMSDAGAVSGGVDIAKAALETSALTSADALDFAAASGKQMTEAIARSNDAVLSASRAALSEGLGFGQDAQNRAYNFSSDMASDAFGLADKSLGFGQDAQNRAYNFARDAQGDVFDFAADSQAAALGLVSDAIGGFRDLASKTVASANDALTRAFSSTPGGGIDASRDLVKWVGMAAVAVIGLGLLVRK